MIHRTHKRFVRELPMAIALRAAERLAAASTDFVLETKPATRGTTAYLSCHFEETLVVAIKQADPDFMFPDQLAEARLRVALDPETPATQHCVCPSGTDRCITQGGHFPACTACGRRLKGPDER